MENTQKTLILFVVVVAITMVGFALTAVPAEAATICTDGTCSYVACSQNADCGTAGFSGAGTCSGNNAYKSYVSFTCQNPGTATAACVRSETPTLVMACTGTCQLGTCVGNIPIVTTTNAGNNPTCQQNFAKKCISNISYWYDSCGAVQSIAQNCGATGQVCSNGSCVVKPTTPTQPSAPFIGHYRTQCYNGNIFWYSSHGTIQDMYKSCSDENTCTVDTCTDLACSNKLMCDGSTCATGSADYVKYCTSTGTPSTGSGQVVCPTNGQCKAVSITFMTRKNADTTGVWTKAVTAINTEKVNFFVTVKNISTGPVDNVSVTANLASAVGEETNVQIDNTPSNGNIVSGINLGTLNPGATKVITFTGTVNSVTVPATAQITSTVTATGGTDTDTVSLTVPTSQVKDNFAAELGASGFMSWVKRWYLWAIVILVLIILFVIIFRRLSTNV